MGATRRQFLKSAGAALTMLALPPAARAAQEAGAFSLRPGPAQLKLRPSGATTGVWSYNGVVPGPVLRYPQGARVRVAVQNRLPQETTVHWHGLRVPNPMDGVPQVTQNPIPIGARFDYEFTAEDAGTFWYHPHQASFEQVGRGLYGLLIVDEPKPVQVDRELAWVLSDFKLGRDNQQVNDFGDVAHLGGGGRLGNVLALNGRPAARRMEVRSGERIRLRLLNAATARIFLIAFQDHEPYVISYDGQPVEPHGLPGGVLLLGPGMRTDLILDCTGKPGDTFSVLDRRDQGAELARIAYAKKPPVRGVRLAPPEALAPHPLPEPDLSKAVDHFVLFEGGLLGRPAIGLVDGKPRKLHEIMSEQKLTWTMNYSAQHEHAQMHEPLMSFRRGEHVRLKLINDTEFEHPMHQHGHSFRVLSLNERPVRYRPWRDTVMMGPRGTAEVAFVAANPGEWMFHCHILEHAAGGMMGTFVVED
jgi:FtsP/CotA-like multicopper oxidase with cupredoxin domain